MKYKEKSELLKALFFKMNREKNLWKNPEELEQYLSAFGGRLKTDKKRRRGYIVCFLQRHQGRALAAELPLDFAEKVLALSGFP